MNKEHILAEIKRTAEANAEKPLGKHGFTSQTGIKYSDWFGIHWARWGDAVREAGLAPNEMTGAYDDAAVIEQYAKLARELGRLPVKGDLRLHRRKDSQFSSDKVFERLGAKAELIRRLFAFCEGKGGYEDVLELCKKFTPRATDSENDVRIADVEIGFVYLIRAGRFYKIGKTNAAGRREREIALQLPDRAVTVHVIRTDDPSGIKSYWHQRFGAKRRNGEWFDLDRSEVAIFKRRKFM